MEAVQLRWRNQNKKQCWYVQRNNKKPGRYMGRGELYSANPERERSSRKWDEKSADKVSIQWRMETVMDHQQRYTCRPTSLDGGLISLLIDFS